MWGANTACSLSKLIFVYWATFSLASLLSMWIYSLRSAFLQKQKIGAKLHIYLLEGTYHER